MKLIKTALGLIICIIIMVSCKKDRYIFTMKYIKLNSFEKSQLHDQYLYIKVVDTDNAYVLASTEKYPSDLPLPVTFGIKPHPQIKLYQRDHISLQLWGDSSGILESSIIEMKKYKIQFPIDMETGNETVSFSVMGTWE